MTTGTPGTSAPSAPILSSLANGVLTITLNRPEKLNSFDRAMGLQLIATLQDAARNDAVRAVLLTGAGRAFCAGQDLSAVLPEGDTARDLGAIVAECYNPAIALIRTTEKPFIAAVNGVAAGAGANLALACDIVLAANEASFIQSFSKIGLIPDSGGTFTLPRLVGAARATALMMLGDKLPAPEAAQIGMIYRALPAETLASESQQLSARLAAMPTRGLGLTKRLLAGSHSSTLSQQLAAEEAAQREAGYTSDYAEGVKAFIEKRAPQFTGR